MNWDIRAETRWQKIAVMALCVAIASAVFMTAWGPFRGAWTTRSEVADPALYEQALEYDPGNADYHFVLAQIYHSSTPHLDADRALQHYLAATEFNPHRSRHWLGLSRLYEDRREVADARKAMSHALETDPNDAQTRWAAANLYVRLGDQAEANQALRRAAELDPRYTEQVLDLVWRFYGDPDLIMSTHVPDTMAADLIALRYFVAQGSDRGAELAWDRLSRVDTEVRDRLGYVNFLVSGNHPHEAYSIFRGDDPDGARALEFFNGSFEDETLNGGFDWIYPAEGLAEVRRDTTQPHDGAASLRIEFSGEENVAYAQISHWLALEPGVSYALSFWMRTEGVTTDEGIYVAVDGQHSEPVIGTTFWKEFEIPFVASSDLVTVRVRRDPSERFDNLLAGKVWVDGFEIRKSQESQ